MQITIYFNVKYKCVVFLYTTNTYLNNNEY